MNIDGRSTCAAPVAQLTLDAVIEAERQNARSSAHRRDAAEGRKVQDIFGKTQVSDKVCGADQQGIRVKDQERLGWRRLRPPRARRMQGRTRAQRLPVDADTHSRERYECRSRRRPA